MFESKKPKRANGLSAAFVQNVKEVGKHFDGQGLGLFLRVEESGKKFWIQRITIQEKRCELGLGAPPVVTLAMAREQALDNKRAIRAGRDPLVEKRQKRQMLNFQEAMEKYLAVKLDEFRNEKHRKQWRSTLDNYAVPVLGKLSVEMLDPSDILRVLQPIWADKTETASRLRGRIEAVLSWATVAGYRRGDNPARWKGNLSEMLAKPSKVAKSGNFAALSLADAPRWWADLGTAEGMGARALQFACLTASRSGEVRGMTWDEVDLDAGLWIIPATRMKAGREHREPLTEAALAILRALPRLNASPYVFYAPQGGMLSDMALSAVMRRMHKKAGENGTGYLDPRSGRAAVPHGLRSTFRDWAAERGVDHVLAELALAHTVGSQVERAYRRTDLLDRRRAVMADWDDFLSGTPI